MREEKVALASSETRDEPPTANGIDDGSDDRSEKDGLPPLS
jgi:hypothetical protein